MDHREKYHHESKNKDVSTCYREGKHARQKGVDLLEGNPYSAPSAFADAWDKGWLDEHDLDVDKVKPVRYEG